MAFKKLLPSLVVMAALTSSLYAQTFQYSRGWTNGKRAEARGDRLEGILERIVDNPCQLGKLKYILEGKPVTDKIFIPCDYGGDDEMPTEIHPKRPPYKRQRSTQDALFDNFL